MVIRSAPVGALLIISASTLLALATSGCQAARHDTSAPKGATVNGDEPADRPQALLPSLDCPAEAPCPAAVGELMAYDNGQLGFCTATLVAPNVILTASHCLPSKTLGPRVDAPCWVRFPSIAQAAKGETHAAENVACTEIMEASSLNFANTVHLNIDYAYVKLARAMSRPPLGMKRKGDEASKPDSVLLYGINLGLDRHSIELDSCARDDGSDLGPLQIPRDQMVILPTCAVRPGFSGGPLLDPLTREILAVISGVVGYDAAHPEAKRVSIGTKVSRPEFLPTPRPRPAVQMKSSRFSGPSISR